MKTKTCSECKQIKSVDKFHKNKNAKDGFAYHCKPCRKKYWEIHTGYDSLYFRKKELIRNYGITLEDYDNIFEKQDGVCAICKKINLSGRRLSVDHNHETGEIRGLLCIQCNTKLGILENKEFLKEATKYLKEYNPKKLT